MWSSPAKYTVSTVQKGIANGASLLDRGGKWKLLALVPFFSYSSNKYHLSRYITRTGVAQ